MDNFACSQIMLFVSLISELFFVFSLLLMSLLLVSDLQFLRGIENFGQEYDCVFKMNLFADYMTEIDHSDASDASGVGAIDKALPGKMHDPFKDATGAMKSISLSIFLDPIVGARIRKNRQRISNADQKVFVNPENFATLLTKEFSDNLCQDHP